jgi:hypothetical protein
VQVLVVPLLLEMVLLVSASSLTVLKDVIAPGMQVLA